MVNKGIHLINKGNYLINKGYKCILITDERGIQYTKDFIGSVKIIYASHLKGNFYFKLKALFKLTLGFFQSIFIIINLKYSNLFGL